MKLCSSIALSLIFMVCLSCHSQTTYDINPSNISHQVDVNIYGHFLEHIYNSANNGLWGDLVWNRSFEMVNVNEGEWSIDNDELIQSSLNTDIRLLMGETEWQDYEISLEAKKLGGAEGFLILFRVNNNDFYWLNLGGWGNAQHAIERGSSQGKTIIGNPVNGSINSDQWYEIKIRCEGNRFIISLDGNTLFDVTDNNAYPSGKVGVGSWATSVAYRNLKVTSIPSDEVLLEGLPELGKPMQAAIPHWESTDNTSLYTHRDRINSDRSVLLVNSSDQFGGIKQGRFNITAQQYTGSFWAKSNPGTSLSIRLEDEASIIDEEEYVSSTSEWEEYSFEFTTTQSTNEGVLQIAFDGTDSVLIDQVSMMGQDASAHDGFRPDLLDAVNGLQPPIIRWPGGCYTSAYFWKDGIGKQEDRGAYTINLWDDMDVNSLGTDEFMQLCELTGAEPLICFNTGILDATCSVPIVEKLTPEQYLQDALDWMEYCNGDITTTWGALRAANGHPEPYNVKYWEIDNEVWSAGIDSYVEIVKKFAPVMREKYPDVKLIACGSGGFDQSWNQILIDECADLIDYVSTHHYEDNNNFASGVQDYENFIKDFANRVAASSNPNLKMYMSEWGVWGPIDWRSGLHTAGILNAFERQGEVFTLAGPALFLRHENACCWNNAFINFNNEDWFPAPNYVVMQLWREYYAPNFIEMEDSNSSLNAVATLSEDSSQLYFKVVNPTSQVEEIELTIDPSFEMNSARMRQVNSVNLYANNTMAQPDNISVIGGSLSVLENGVSFEVQPYSASVIALERKTESREVLSVGHSSGILINAPNPFSDKVSISFKIVEKSETRISIYDQAGRLITMLMESEFLPGEYSLDWNGENSIGNAVGNGVYFVELMTQSGKSVQRVMLSR
jgi:alpha-N-arabinofuranosidase